MLSDMKPYLLIAFSEYYIICISVDAGTVGSTLGVALDTTNAIGSANYILRQFFVNSSTESFYTCMAEENSTTYDPDNNGKFNPIGQVN